MVSKQVVVDVQNAQYGSSEKILIPCPKNRWWQGFLDSLNTQRYGVKTVLLKPLNEWF